MAEKYPLPNSVIMTAAEIDDDEAAVVCLTQLDMNSTSNTVTSDTFCGTETLVGSIGQTLSVSFRRIWIPDADHVSEAFFYNAWKNKTHIQFTIGPISPATGDIVYTGTGYVTAYNNQNGTNAVPLASMTLSCDEIMSLTVTT